MTVLLARILFGHLIYRYVLYSPGFGKIVSLMHPQSSCLEFMAMLCKVGSMRIDAALDSMRPMGFPDDVVRKSIKDLLKVYGEDGWIFIEEASYKLLIETIIEGQEEGRAGGDDASGSGEKSGSLQELCDKEERCQEEKCVPVEIDAQKGPSKKSQTHHHFISKDGSGQPQHSPPVDFAPTCSPMECVPTNQTHKSSCGWLDADDEDD